MAEKASRAQLFNAANIICGRIFAIEIEYEKIIQREIARRDKKLRQMGITGRFSV